MPAENAEIARLFREAGDLLELEGANPFRIRAYRNAARIVENHPEPVQEIAERATDGLTDLPGIGDDLAGKIREICRSGSFPALEELRHKFPGGLLELLNLPSLGPKLARTLHDERGIRSVGDLKAALDQGTLTGIRGIGPRTRDKLAQAVAASAGVERRFLRPIAAQYGDALLKYLRSMRGIDNLEIAGSYRRRKDTVGDLDVLATARDAAAVIRRFVSYPEVAAVTAEGTTRAAIRLRSGMQVDLRVLPDESYGAGLYYFTGSKAHNIAARRMAQARGLKLNEYGVWRGARRVAGRTEAEVCKAIGLPVIPPELREDRGEIAAALKGRLPRLVMPDDIRGDLQSHTTDSDGRDTLEAMARAAEALGYEYLAVTDHSPAVRVAGGLDREGFRKQRARIDRLNGKLRKLTLLAGAEVDILADGSLDLDDRTLAGLDVVVISIHSKFSLPAKAQTRRVLRAIRHPSVDIFGHPTGRLIGRRPGAGFDLHAVFEAAADRGILLEVNAQPERLDLDDIAARAAIDHGLQLVISTDAHSTTDLGFMRWGVDQARRGWAEAKNVANTLPLARLRRLLHGSRA